MAIIEDLTMGSAEHTAPAYDPSFEQLEPNSGIRLSSRSLPHDDLQDYLRGRYYLSPSKLYSVIRLSPNKQGYDVPVDGDWVTIAVVAERGPVKVSRAPVSITPGEDDGQASDGEHAGATASDGKKGYNGNGKDKWKGNGKGKGKGKEDEEAPKPSGKKYVNMRLIDFGARTRSSATGGKAVVRGDAFLSLLLFEADTFDEITEEGGRKRKVYRGGSRGAYEAMSRLKEGDVIALLNPKVLRPFQRTNEKPHPSSNILAVTPESAGSIEVIGRAKDLGMCKAAKRDGKPCGSWCDTRVSDVCDYHLQSAVQSRKAARPEFSIGTSGLTSSAAAGGYRKRKEEFDPARKWGLQPSLDGGGGAGGDGGGGGATYVVSGHVVNNSRNAVHVAENMGREGQAKAKRKLEKDADKELLSLLERDKTGMRAVMRAREVGEGGLRKLAKGQAQDKHKDKDKDRAKGKDKEPPSTSDMKPAALAKSTYSATIIKQLGFDPASKAGQHQSTTDAAMQKKLDTLAALQSDRKNIRLGSRPGPKIRSGVSVPEWMQEHEESGEAGFSDGEPDEIDLDDSDD
ncbi:hypothetical protein CONPUDRAFT_92621 [Coniophora puteana RWD-64-598 SS2]|uniref:Zinc finger Mcm10/DnaG-type domain-containing protein n=1 Tax=Coniophora puteana (strain RWD-64-598) TaxID=741705 RepID=A0A5M3MBL4_CONPW|nr:uncharacterized protein CONPUDRAFT_92621 [Coniophora puteana RWD-64-598 SS2]EIW76628.1 hypothetical protein CONPUDRAFT_92621 [Coniophora puteana RWD-64-598 SS2]